MKIKIITTALVVFISISNSCYGANSSSKKSWASLTQQDVKFSYEAIQRIAPYTFFQSEPELSAWLKKGYTQALAQAEHASSYDTYKAVLQKYINGFNIEHLEVSFQANKLTRPSNKQKINTVSYRKFLNNSIWITIPSFQAGSGFNHPKLEESLQRLTVILPKFRNKDLIIFDVRGNGGGSSDLARPLIVSLYSKEYLLSLGSSFIWNQKWIYIDSLFSGSDEYYSSNLKYKRAMEKGENLYEGNFWPIFYGQNTNQSFNKQINPVHAHVIILSDSRCGSMCYQFTRTLLDLPNTILIGVTPDTMGRLTNPYIIELPSQQANLSIGTREMIAPSYAFGHDLKPKYTFKGDITKDSDVRKWIFNLYQNHKL